jgi:hypothetical protein
MSSKLLAVSGSLLSIVFIVIVIGSYVIVAQSVVTGEWRADTRNDSEKNDGKIQFNFERRSAGGHHNQSGFPIALDELQGLSRDQLQNAKVSFRLVREAGTIECVGTFSEGRGSGTFTFTADPAYLDAMRSRGFDFEKSSKHDDNIEDRLFTAAVINVTTALADDLRSADLGPLDVDDLFKAAIFKVDSRFMAEMKATGFPNLKMEDLVKARIFKIDADYVRQVHDMGFADSDFEGLVKFRIFKVTPEYLSELRSSGMSDLSAEDVVRFRIFKIDADFVRAERARNPNVTVEDLVRMKIGVHVARENED